MATLLERLTSESIEIEKIPIHNFFAAIREYVRGYKTIEEISQVFNVPLDDPHGAALLSNLEAAPTIAEKLDKVSNLEDVLLLHESRVTRPLYPDLNAIALRFGLV